MILPNVLIIGAQKCGTTWLGGQVGRHPDVYMAPGEIHYFDKAHRWKRGPGWYGGHFTAAAGHRWIGEKTPDYLWANGQGAEGHLPHVHRNIHSLLPNARLMTVLRNPVDRVASALLHLIRTGRLPPDSSLDELAMHPTEVVRLHGVIEKGYYLRQIMAYLELYSGDRMLTLIYEEDVVARPDLALLKVCGFLDIDPARLPPIDTSRKNESRHSRIRLALNARFPSIRYASGVLDRLAPPYRPSLAPETRAHLAGLYAQENAGLFRLLNRPMPATWQ